MEPIWQGHKRNRVLLIYEWTVWIIYACLFKYAHYLDQREYYLQRTFVPVAERQNFPLPQLAIYALAMTLYIIPWYRLIVPALLKRRRYGSLVLTTLLYFLLVPKFTNWLVSSVFLFLSGPGPLHEFYSQEQHWYGTTLHHIGGIEIKILLTDIISFLSIAFMHFALDNEQKKHQLEKDNLELQLDALKAQLHPHFLFNTLNSIYALSLTGSPSAPGFILRLSGMMRYILYDCRQNKVPLEKDLEFLDNYLAMEQQRYPGAQIRFTIENQAGPEEPDIVPLLFIPLLENSFKHGAHRVLENSFISGKLRIEKDKLQFELENDVLNQAGQDTKYGGVGLENLRRRLELYYPGNYTLDIQKSPDRYQVSLLIRI